MCINSSKGMFTVDRISFSDGQNGLSDYKPH